MTLDWKDYDRSRFHENDPDGVLLDSIQFRVWCGLMHWLMEQEGAHQQFAEATGREHVPLGAEERISDDATRQDFLNHYTGDFVRWATREHWGDAEVTPSIRGAIGKFPTAQ